MDTFGANATTGKGFYGEINIMIFLKKLNGNYDVILSTSELYEFYLYLDSLCTSTRDCSLLQRIFNKVYNEDDLFMHNTVSIGNHMTLSLSSEYGVTLFEALACTMHHICHKLQSVLDTEREHHKSDDRKDDNNSNDEPDVAAYGDDDDDEDDTGSVVLRDINEETQKLTNNALIIWDIIRLVLRYHVRVFHIECNQERISYYPLCMLYQSFLILFGAEEFKGDIIDRYLALILKSIDLHAMNITDNCSSNRDRDKQLVHKNENLAIDYFMPAILSIAGDPDIVLCHFWFGGAFPIKSMEEETEQQQHHNIADVDTGMDTDPDMDMDSSYDGIPSPQIVMNLWFRGFEVVSFCWSAEDIVTEYDHCDLHRNRIHDHAQVWDLHVLHQYGRKMVVYLWIFKMMYKVIQRRFVRLMRVCLHGWDESMLVTLSEYHLGVELNTATTGTSDARARAPRWHDTELTYYAMLHIFAIRSDWLSWVASKVLPELSQDNLNLVKQITKYPEVTQQWNDKLRAQIFNMPNAQFMQYVFIYGGQFSVDSMRLLLAVNACQYEYVGYLLSSAVNFNDKQQFWALFENSSLFVGILNNKNVSNDVLELILFKMQTHFDGKRSQRIINDCCITQFCQIATFTESDIIWKRLLWLLLKKSKYASIAPFNALDVHQYGIPIICKKLDVLKLRYFIGAKLLNARLLLNHETVVALCSKNEDDADYDQTMRFLVVMFDWITEQCKEEPYIQTSLAQYREIAAKYREYQDYRQS